jgi:hypothetical protein
MMKQTLESLITSISSISTTTITKSIAQKSLDVKNDSLESFIQSLISDELDFLAELVYIRINVIDAVEKLGMFTEQWLDLIKIWNSITNCQKYYRTALVVKKGVKVIYSEAIEFLCKELSRGKKLGKHAKLDYLTRECMNANWKDITASGSVEILRKEARINKKEKLIVNLVNIEGSWYTASLSKDHGDRSIDSWKISRVLKGKPLVPLHPYKKCQLCDKNHFIGECHFSSKGKKQELLKELYYDLRMKELWI